MNNQELKELSREEIVARMKKRYIETGTRTSTKFANAIVNPAAGGYSTYKKWPPMSKYLRNKGLLFDYEYTEGIVLTLLELAYVLANEYANGLE